MPSLFTRLARVASAPQTRLYGEGFTLSPQVAPTAGPSGRPDVNARRQAAPTAVLPFAGIFVAKGALVYAKGRNQAANTTHAVQAETPMIDVAVDAFSTPPARGDRIERAETGETFTVSRFEPTDCGRAWIHLNDGQAPERDR